MSGCVLDASALLAMLKQEAGAAMVAEGIASARISAINHAEVVSYFIRRGMPADDVDAMLDRLPIEVVTADKGLATLAGRLRALTAQAGLSLGDRFCLALAQRDGLPAWTADKAWKSIADLVGVEVITIR